MGFSQQQPPDPRFLMRPDALQAIPGQGVGTQPGPQTYPMPGGNALQNLALVLEQGLTIPPSAFGVDMGTPTKFWDPKVLGLLTGIAAVLEPGPGGEMKALGKADEVFPVVGLGKGKTAKLLGDLPDDIDKIADEIINGKALPAVKSVDGTIYTRKYPAEHGDLIPAAEDHFDAVFTRGDDTSGWLVTGDRYVSYGDLQRIFAPGEKPNQLWVQKTVR